MKKLVPSLITACRNSGNLNSRPCTGRIEIPVDKQFMWAGERVVAFSVDSDGVVDGHFVAMKGAPDA